MKIALLALLAFIAFLHLSFLVLEMFLWTHPRGLKIFGHTLEKAEASYVLAKNQGLYNGFLAAGLIWAILVSGAPEATSVQGFFLSCVAIAGIYGGITVSARIFLIQAVPAIIALALLVVSRL